MHCRRAGRGTEEMFMDGGGDAEVAVTAVGLSQVVRLTLSRLPVGIPELDMISMLDVGVSSAQVDICDL